MKTHELALLLGTNAAGLTQVIDGLSDDRLNEEFQRRVILRRACGRALDDEGYPLPDLNAPVVISPAEKMRKLKSSPRK